MKRLALALALVAACGGSAVPSSAPGQPTQPSAGSPAPAATVQPTPTRRTTPAPVTAPPRAELEVVESGYTFVPGDTNYIQYAVLIENPNLITWVAETNVVIALYDESGDVITTQNERVTALPGQRTAVGGTIFDAEGVTELDVQLNPDWEEIDFTPGSFSVDRIRITHDEFSTKVTGVVTCDFEESPEYVQVVAVLRDDAGDIVGGEIDILEDVRCDDGSPFEAQTLSRIRNATKAEAYASL